MNRPSQQCPNDVRSAAEPPMPTTQISTNELVGATRTLASSALSSPAAFETRDTAIQQYAPLVKYVIRRLAIRMPATMDQEDMISYGTIGLIQALDRFDDSKGVKFEAFAISRIRGAILDALRKLDRMPRAARQNVKLLRLATFELTTSLGRQPTEAELAVRMAMTAKQFSQTMIAASWMTVSLDGLLDRDENNDNRHTTEFPADPNDEDFTEQVEHRELRSALIRGVEKLRERESLIVSLYYKDGMTLREIAQILEVSESRVSQLNARALSQLRLGLDDELRAA